MTRFASANIPSSVYRLQLSASFSLMQATQTLPYLHKLGIEALYLSPIFDAYSPHGYDVTDPNRLNPALGTPQDFETLCQSLQSLGMGLILDVVPNHMGMKGGKNAWWQDVLTNGPASRYAPFFDIDWEQGKILLPILDGEELIVEEGQLRCGEYLLPLAPSTQSLKLPQLLEAQHYRLADWRSACHEINYRRFFDIHELVALCIESKEVLKAHHAWVFQLLKEGRVQGLRIDHPDGLYDPATYFQRLRAEIPVYTVVEKILDREENLPTNWDVEGTVGYEYINLLTGLFIKSEHADAFTDIYDAFLGHHADFEEIVYQAKKLYTMHYMASEVNALGRKLAHLSKYPLEDLTFALQEVIAAFPVYRTYIAPKGGIGEHDSLYLTQAIMRAKKRAPHLNPSLFDFLDDLFHLRLDETYRDFILRFQQLTGPIMAKGFEDTALYRYNRFLALNEVGGDPVHFGRSQEEYHTFCKEKLSTWPYGFLPSSTHDTKRSEDVRMRLAVLSEIPKLWQEKVQAWAAMNASELPPNTEYFLYQTLVGIWPRNVWSSILKSLREMKQETNWHTPDLAYEKRVEDFFTKLLTPGTPFYKDFSAFHAEIDRCGALNSLAATAVKMASPGVVDTYQGNETFTYRLVDPDNRGPVTFEQRPQEPKWQLHEKALCFRRAHKELLLDGHYHPFPTSDRLIAFGRSYSTQRLLVLAGRFFTTSEPYTLHLPHEWQKSSWTEVFTGEKISTVNPNELLKIQPYSYLYANENR